MLTNQDAMIVPGVRVDVTLVWELEDDTMTTNKVVWFGPSTAYVAGIGSESSGTDGL